MSKVCYFTGKKPRMGKTIARRGIAKKSGGIGLKTTGITRRRFLPNLQTVKIIENGTVKTVRVSAKYLKTGKVVKAPKRNWKPSFAKASEGRPFFAKASEGRPSSPPVQAVSKQSR